MVKLEMDIGVQPYRELKAFCLQYPEKKRKASAEIGAKASMRFTESQHNAAAFQNPVEQARQSREKLIRDVDLIEKCASAVQDGRFYQAIIQNCCFGKPLSCLPPEIMQTSNRNAYFRARYEFFYLLWIERSKI